MNKFKIGHLINYRGNEFYDLVLSISLTHYELFYIDETLIGDTYHYPTCNHVDNSDILITDIFNI